MGFITRYFTTIWDTTILVHFFPSINLQLGWCWSWWANETTGLPVSLSNGPSTWATSLTWFAPTRWFCLIPFYPDKNLFGGIFWGFLGWFTHSWQRAAHSFHQLLDPSCFHGIFRRRILPNAPLPRTPRLEMIEWKLPKIYSTFNSDVFFRISMVIIFRFHFPFLFFWECYHSLQDDEISVMLYKLSSDIPNDNLGCWKGGNFESIQHRSLPPKPSGLYVKWVRKPTQNSAKIGCHFKAEQ